MFQQHVWTTLSARQASGFLSKTQLWDDCCNRLEDVDSRLDVLIHKASIAFKSRCPDNGPHGPNARALDMKIACIKSTVRTIFLLVRTRKALVWKLLVVEVRPSERQGITVRMWLKTGKNFSVIFGKPITQLSVRTPYDNRPDGAYVLSSKTLI